MNPAPRFPRRGTPHSFGWIRVSALDEGAWLCWERPDGAKVWVHSAVGLVQVAADVAPEPDREAVGDLRTGGNR